jgi:beta-N-acetylhexosaminidase
MEERFLGQLLLTGVPGPELDPATARRLRDLQAGGFILFSRNLRSPGQLRRLIDDLRDLSDFEPIITIDQEGGRVSRLRYIGNEPPNAVQLTAKGDAKLILRHGELTADLLRLFGFNLNLCPVLDIGWDDSADNSLRGRTWGQDPQQVITNAGVFNRGMRGGGILSCGKHFPGYASADVDPHEELPVIRKSLAQMEAEELLPFSALLPELDSLMTCHSHYPCFDPDQPRLPASLSHNIVTRLLRDRMGFEGLVMTDDLDMGAILNEVGFEQTIQGAVLAGNDLLMICHRLEMVEEAKQHLKGVPGPALQLALERVEAAKRKLKPPTAFSDSRFKQIDGDIWRLRVDTLGEEQAALLSDEDGKRSPVELY